MDRDPASTEAPGLVLLVGCDPDSTQIFRMSLEQRGFSVLLADDGAHALDLARRHRPVALVSGMRTARRSGRTLRRALAAEPSTARVRVLAVCSIPPALTPWAPEPDADQTLVLPVSPEHLSAAVEAMLF